MVCCCKQNNLRGHSGQGPVGGCAGGPGLGQDRGRGRGSGSSNIALYTRFKLSVGSFSDNSVYL